MFTAGTFFILDEKPPSNRSSRGLLKKSSKRDGILSILFDNDRVFIIIVFLLRNIVIKQKYTSLIRKQVTVVNKSNEVGQRNPYCINLKNPAKE
jgi:hypothetical protein